MPPIGVLQEAMAARALQFGAVGIAEDHEERHGRDLALRLIESNSVRRLFVELSTAAYQGQIDRAAQLRAQGRDAVRGRLGFSCTYKCPIALEEVVAAAIVKGIPVHCVDDKVAMNPNRAKTPSGMRTRNATVVKNACEITEAAGPQASARDAGAIGSLFLFGGAHFEGNDSITAMYRDFVWIKAG